MKKVEKSIETIASPHQTPKSWQHHPFLQADQIYKYVVRRNIQEIHLILKIGKGYVLEAIPAKRQVLQSFICNIFVVRQGLPREKLVSLFFVCLANTLREMKPMVNRQDQRLPQQIWFWWFLEQCSSPWCCHWPPTWWWWLWWRWYISSCRSDGKVSTHLSILQTSPDANKYVWSLNVIHHHH